MLPEIWRSDEFELTDNEYGTIDCSYGLFVFKKINKDKILFQKVYADCLISEGFGLSTNFHLDIDLELKNNSFFYLGNEVGSYSSRHLKFDIIFPGEMVRARLDIKKIDGEKESFTFEFDYGDPDFSSVFSLFKGPIRPIGNLNFEE